jgi:hypothetical protein
MAFKSYRVVKTREVQKTAGSEWDESTRNLVGIALRELGWETALNYAEIGEVRDAADAQGVLYNQPTVFSIALNKLLDGKFTSVTSAFEEAQALVPEWEIRNRSARQLIYEFGVVDCTNVSDISAAAAALGAKGKLSLSAYGTEKQSRLRAEAASQREIISLIQRITLGKTLFVLPQSLQRKFLGCDYGKARNVESESFLTGKPVEVLREIADAVEAYRNARGSRGSSLNPSKIDDAEGLASNYKPTHQQQQLHQQVQPEPADLISPATGQRYSRSEVLKLIQTDLATFRKLKQQNVRLLDQILQSRN